MNTILEKAAYLKGLAEGLNISSDTNEGKLLKALVDFVDEMAVKIDEVDDYCGELEEYIGEVDKDLGELEEECYDLDDEDEEEDFYELKCPNCDETVYIDGDDLDSEEEISCPNCGEPIEIDLCDDEECGCGCDHCDE